MKQRLLRLILLCIIPIVTTGCWDRTELSDLAFKMGLAMDKAPDGQYIATAQIAVPSQLAGNPSGGGGGGGQDKGYYVVSGQGKDTRDAIQNMQNKLSRRVHAGHRRAIFVGENLAREGMRVIIDTNTRDPETRLRTDLFVVKGGDGRDILDIYYPFERVPVLGTTKMHRVIGGTADTEFRDFLIDTFDNSTAPTLPVIQEYQDAEQVKGAFRFGGRAIFNRQLRLIGYLNPDESTYRGWVRGKIRYYVVTFPAPKVGGTVPGLSSGNNQTDAQISVNLTNLGRSVHTAVQGNRVTVYVNLKARGDLRENTSALDLEKPANLNLVRAALNQYVSTQTESLVQKCQQQYDADIFGFGAAIHRQHPIAWKAMERQWSSEFPHTKVIVRANVEIKRLGLATSMTENEVSAQS